MESEREDDEIEIVVVSALRPNAVGGDALERRLPYVHEGDVAAVERCVEAGINDQSSRADRMVSRCQLLGDLGGVDDRADLGARRLVTSAQGTEQDLALPLEMVANVAPEGLVHRPVVRGNREVGRALKDVDVLRHFGSHRDCLDARRTCSDDPDAPARDLDVPVGSSCRLSPLAAERVQPRDLRTARLREIAGRQDEELT
jgi:hypothetical protein